MEKRKEPYWKLKEFISRDWPYLLLIIPALILYILFSIVPMFSAFKYSFTNWDGFSREMKFIALNNYAYMLKDSGLLTAIKNTGLFVIMDVVLQNILGLSTALILESKIYTRNTLRTLFFIPVVLPAIVVSYLWSYIYGFNGGALNEILVCLGLNKIDFIGDYKIAIYFVVLAGVWQWVSYRTVIFISGLQGISREIYEAADLDGVTGWQRFRYITLPQLTPAIRVNVLLCTITALKQFDIVFTMTGGGPGDSTQVIATKIFKEAFSRSDYGYGCAIGVFLFLVILIFTVVFTKFFDRKEDWM